MPPSSPGRLRASSRAPLEGGAQPASRPPRRLGPNLQRAAVREAAMASAARLPPPCSAVSVRS
eukprot:2348850-Pyramimonas_sp.AAC.1